MAFSISDIRSQLALGGARPTLFQVQFVNPANSTADIKVPFLCFAASLPSQNMGLIQVPYFGRTIKLAGDRTFEGWTVTIYNDEDFLIRNALEHWCGEINSMQGNLRGFGTSASSAYKTTALVTQFSKTGTPLRTYRMDGIYPQNVSAIDVDWGRTDDIEKFQVGFQYDWFEVVGGVTGSGAPV